MPDLKPKSYTEIMQDLIDSLNSTGGWYPESVLSPIVLDNLDTIIRMDGETDKQLAERIRPSECECGKEKHGFASHSTWCKKWRQE